MSSVTRARPGPDDRDRGVAQDADLGAAADEQSGRRIVDLPQGRRETGIGARQPANALAGQSREITTGVEAASEAPESLVARLRDDVRPAFGGEGGQGELAHAAGSSAGER